MNKRIKEFDTDGRFIIERRPDEPSAKKRLAAQRAWIAYGDVCKALGLPVLWESPLAAREAWEIGKKYNGGKKRRATKREMQERRNNATHNRS